MTCCERTQSEVETLQGEFANMVRAVYRALPQDHRDNVMAVYAFLEKQRAEVMKPKRGGYTHGKRREEKE